MVNTRPNRNGWAVNIRPNSNGSIVNIRPNGSTVNIRPNIKGSRVNTRPNIAGSTVNTPKGFLPTDLSVIGSPESRSKTEERDLSILDQGDSMQMTQFVSTQRYYSTLDILKKREEAQRKLKEKMRLKEKAAVL